MRTRERMSHHTPSNFLSGLEFFFVTKKLGRVQHKIILDKITRFGGAVSDRVNESTTHVLFPRGVDYKSGLDSLKLTALPDSVTTVGIDWLPECIVARKLVPTTEFEVSVVKTNNNVVASGLAPGSRANLEIRSGDPRDQSGNSGNTRGDWQRASL